MEVIRQATGKYRLQLDTTEDKIAAYIAGSLEDQDLNEKEHELVKRYLQIWTLLSNPSYSPNKAIKAHMRMCKKLGMEISLRTAQYDMKHSSKIFGDIYKISREAKRAIYEEMQMLVFKKALQANDLKELNRSIANLINLWALNREDPEIPTANNQPSLFVMNVYTSKSSEPRVINLDELNQVPRNEMKEILNAIEADEITEVELLKILKDGKEGTEFE